MNEKETAINDNRAGFKANVVDPVDQRDIIDSVRKYLYYEFKKKMTTTSNAN
jgi:hypothetical protein